MDAYANELRLRLECGESESDIFGDVVEEPEKEMPILSVTRSDIASYKADRQYSPSEWHNECYPNSERNLNLITVYAIIR